MKIKIVVGLLAFMVSMNVAGCGGCGTTQEETSVVAEMEETEKVIEETEVTENIEEDYADSLVEVEGGDGEEVTEEVVESTENEVEETQPVETFEPYQMFTNTNCNVRAQASKDSELVATLSVNTEITVVGIEGEWSKVEVNGLQAYIKSSLLSSTKTEVKQPSNSGSASNTGSNNQSQTQSGGTSQPSQPDTSPDPQPSQPSQSEQKALEDAINSLGWGESGDVVMGSGTTGSTTDGHYGGVQ